MEVDLKFIAELIHTLSGVELKVIENTDESWELYLQQESRKSFLTLLNGSKSILKQFHLQPHSIYEFKFLRSIYATCFCDHEGRYLYLLGPNLVPDFSEREYRTLLHMGKLSEETFQRLLIFAKSLPSISPEAVYKVAIQLMQKICGDAAPIMYREVNLVGTSPSSLSAIDPPSQPVDLREIEERYEFSKLLTEAVKQGNYSLAQQVLGSRQSVKLPPARSSSPLRNMQNYCIIANTQMRHALENSGVHPYKLDQLSTKIGIQVEQLKSLKSAENFLNQIIRQYCNLVQEHNYPNLKPLVHLAVTYIKDHLTENITVMGTAEALTVNANYLSSVFRKEMGISFIDFVNRERVKQAANLIKHSNLQIQQIAILVGYNNTSYFDKQFLKIYGVSPQVYRIHAPM